MRNTLLAVACACLPTLAAAQYKCTAPSGAVAYQQAPCEAAARGEKVRISTAQTVDEAGAKRAATYEQRELARLEWQEAVNKAIIAGVPMVGMTADELRNAIGWPSRTNLSNYGRGLESQQIYERPGATWYVYLKGGVVTSLQTSAR